MDWSIRGNFHPKRDLKFGLETIVVYVTFSKISVHELPERELVVVEINEALAIAHHS